MLTVARVFYVSCFLHLGGLVSARARQEWPERIRRSADAVRASVVIAAVASSAVPFHRPLYL